MSLKKIGLVAAGAVVVGGLTFGGAAIASAATSAPTPGASAGAGHAHTPVTGDEAAKVTAAVTAKDSAVTVTAVQKDPDGSYDVLGTRNGTPVRYDASADLTTITEGRGGPGGHGGGRAGNDTPVTGDEAAKVTAAVTAKDAAVTVDGVRKDPDGSYDVVGTKAGNRIMFDVSADLKTITENAGRPQRNGTPPAGAPRSS
ncbi:hypothetical protein [Krasilnikovia sp. MM14-A1004]|uniref:hypothetical protein n=1 Tax=Krasilnikovia sp. MM14-A1004 TaxID=3373541 RepID=UPI00399C98C1